MAGNYTAWYRAGSVTVTKGSEQVTGTETYWANAGVNPGDIFTLDASTFYEIASVTDGTHITLRTPFTGNTASKQNYAIIRNFTASMQADIAARTVDILTDMRRYLDMDFEQMHGKSAYEIAVENGYVGSESQWLQSLVGNGEWISLKQNVDTSLTNFNTRLTTAENTVTTLNSKTGVLATARGSGYHNSICQGKNRGSTFTAEESTAITNGTFGDMFIGDYWMFTNVKYQYTDLEGNTTEKTATVSWVIVAFNPLRDDKDALPSGNHIMLISNDIVGTYPYNTEETVNGGYVGSVLHTVGDKNAAALAEACFGADHVLTFSQQMSTSLTTNAITSTKAMAPTARMLHGTRPPFDIASANYQYAYLHQQLPFFRLYPAGIVCTNAYWYQDLYPGGATNKYAWKQYSDGTPSSANVTENNNLRAVIVVR